MKWTAGKKDSKTQRPYFYYSDCGEYYVGIPISQGERSLAFYKRSVPKGEREYAAVMIGGYANPDIARQACETHSRSSR